MPLICLRPALAGASRAVIRCFLNLSMLMVLLVKKVKTNEPSYHRQQAGQTHVQGLVDLCTTYFPARLVSGVA